MGDILESAFAVLGASLVFAIATRAFSSAQLVVLWRAFAARVMFSFAQTAVYVWYYKGGDIFYYMEVGGRLASVTSRDPVSYLPELLGACVGLEPTRGLAMPDLGSTTANMHALVGVFRLFHDSIWAVGIWFGLLSFTAQAFAYVAVSRLVGQRHDNFVKLAFLYTPSVAFWSASITKETVAVAGLSLVMYGVSSLSRARMASGLAVAGAGAVLMIVSKPYLMIPLGIAMAAYALRRQKQQGGPRVPGWMRTLRPFVLVVLAAGSVIVPGMLFPNLRPEKVVETANYRRSVAYGQGGSDIQHPDADSDDDFGLAYIPIGLTAALFRPFFFEARNFTQLLNIIETTAILYFVLRMIFRTGIRGIVRKILDDPELTFCMVFTLMTALAVGMSNPNLGTISRYRAPMMPFYVLAILILNESTRTTKSRAALAPAVAPTKTLVPPKPKTLVPPSVAGTATADAPSTSRT